MDYSIRELRQNESKVLNTFLYEAIFIPEGAPIPPKEIINQPELQVYVKDFGKNKGDLCLVAEANNEIVGAVWCRIMNDYGHIDDSTPSLAISLYKEYRGLGIGKALLKKMLAVLEKDGYEQVSLSVQKSNYAVKLYQKIGFTVYRENEEEYIMKCKSQAVGMNASDYIRHLIVGYKPKEKPSEQFYEEIKNYHKSSS